MKGTEENHEEGIYVYRHKKRRVHNFHVRPTHKERTWIMMHDVCQLLLITYEQNKAEIKQHGLLTDSLDKRTLEDGPCTCFCLYINNSYRGSSLIRHQVIHMIRIREYIHDQQGRLGLAQQHCSRETMMDQ